MTLDVLFIACLGGHHLECLTVDPKSSTCNGVLNENTCAFEWEIKPETRMKELVRKILISVVRILIKKF